MFSYLVNTVFPALGKFYGLFAHLGEMPFSEFARMFLVFPNSSDALSFEFLNLYNGDTHSFLSPLAALYNGLLPLTDLPSFIQNIVFLPYSLVFRLLSFITNSVFDHSLMPILESVGMSSQAPTWLALLMLCPLFSIGIGFLKHVFDGLPWL